MPTSNHRSAGREDEGRGRVARVACGLIAIAGLLAAAWVLAFAEPVVAIEGIEVALRDEPARTLDAFEEAFLGEEVTVDAGEVITHASRRSLGIRIDRAGLEQELRSIRSAFRTSPSAWWATLAGAPIHRLSLGAALVEEPAFEYLSRLREEVDAAPVAPHGDRLDSITEGRPGRMLDMLQAMHVLRGAATEQTYFVLPVEVLAPPSLLVRTRADADFRRVLASFEERYRVGDDAFARATNVEQAAEALDGAILVPGATLSFNEVVGERTLGRGFLPAIEIANGRRVQGIGGGICQVAGALYAAATRAGLDVKEHHAHSLRARSRRARARDTAVAWGSKDLRIENPYRFHVRLSVTAEGGELRVALRGARPSAPAPDGPIAAREPQP
jgi:vancomycin resistance protein YoaR